MFPFYKCTDNEEHNPHVVHDKWSHHSSHKNHVMRFKRNLETVDPQCRLPVFSSTVATLKRQISSVPQEFMLDREDQWRGTGLTPHLSSSTPSFPLRSFQGDLSHVPTSPKWHRNMFSLHLGSRPPSRAHTQTHTLEHTIEHTLTRTQLYYKQPSHALRQQQR